MTSFLVKTTTMSDSYIHGATDEIEVARLEKQAAFIARRTWNSFFIAPGSTVLDLATGVGATAHQLTLRFPDITLTAVDLSETQLAAAKKNHSELNFMKADATALPFERETFDVVHCSWLLEHVPNPMAVLKEVYRVLKVGGFCRFLEVDNATFHTVPQFDSVNEIMGALNAKQLMLGGDPFVAQRLPKLFSSAGFRKFVIEPHRFDVTPENPIEFQEMVDEFAEIFDGLDESLGAELPKKAAAQMRTLGSHLGARLKYTSSMAIGMK
jgi:ubiquinone/menaquinone biosynthesis C-methylase UbiE